MKVNGSGASLTKEELDQVKKELEEMKKEFGFKEPDRSYMEGVPESNWRFGGPPDYSLANYAYFKGRTKQHAEGSLEMIVENLVKTWEMERSHKLDSKTHQSVDPEKFKISANGGKVYNNEEANAVGNYNVLLDACPAEVWDKSNISHEESHRRFHKAFAAFPWEVLEVFSGPPKVAFTWRHWAEYTGEYEEAKGNGELVEMFGFGTAIVNAELKLLDVEIFYNAEEFISVLRGQKTVEEVNQMWPKGSCPHLEQLKKKEEKKEA